MPNIVSHLGQNFNWISYKNGHNPFTITCTESSVAFDLSDYTFTLNIKKTSGGATVLTLTEGSGITNGGASGIISIALTEAQASTTLKGDTYFYELIYDVGGLTYAFIQGILTLSNELNPSSSATSLSATINLAGSDVNAAITLNGAFGNSNIDGGSASATYLASQHIDGGGA